MFVINDSGRACFPFLSLFIVGLFEVSGGGFSWESWS